MFGTNAVQALDKTAKVDVINAWVAGDRDFDPDGDGLSNLREYDGGFEPTDPWNAYSVYENFFEYGLLLPGTPKFNDKEAKRFGISEADINNDDDNDLLTNLQELQAYYYDKTALADLDPEKAWSDGATPDYFRAVGSTYLGLLFNGGEWIEPDMRSMLGISRLTRAGTRDLYNEGWDLWSLSRYGQTAGGDDEETIQKNLVIKYMTAVYGEAVHPFEGGDLASVQDYLYQRYRSDFFGFDGQYRYLETVEDFVEYLGGEDKIKEAIAAKGGSYSKPTPKINVTVKYAANVLKQIFVEAYQVSSAYPEAGEQMTARWSASAAFDSGIANVRSSPTSTRTATASSRPAIPSAPRRRRSATLAATSRFGSATATLRCRRSASPPATRRTTWSRRWRSSAPR